MSKAEKQENIRRAMNIQGDLNRLESRVDGEAQRLVGSALSEINEALDVLQSDFDEKWDETI